LFVKKRLHQNLSTLRF